MLLENRNNLLIENCGIFEWGRIKVGDRFVIVEEVMLCWKGKIIIVVVEECFCLCCFIIIRECSFEYFLYFLKIVYV